MVRDFLRRLFVGPYSATILQESSGAIPFVGPTNALRYTPVYRAVTLIAGDIARIECEVSAQGAEAAPRPRSLPVLAAALAASMALRFLLGSFLV